MYNDLQRAAFSCLLFVMAVVCGRPSGLPGFRTGSPTCTQLSPLFGDEVMVFGHYGNVFMEKTADPYIPTLFTRHKAHLHTLLLENQVWFCARDLGRLMGLFLDERMTRKLGRDERRTLALHRYGLTEDTLMVNESGAYALLIYHPSPHNRELREWLTLQVVPALRDAHHPGRAERPILGLLDWDGASVNLLHWQNEPWIRLRDMPNMLLHETREQRPWWKRATRFLSM